MENFNVSAFEKYDKQWALVTAGNLQDYNTMTISWGGLGTLWNKPVATVYIRPSRYTYKYIEENEFFTVSFYPEEYKKDLGILGKKSGRDGDKVALTSLKPKQAGETVTFEQAELTLLCRKIYSQDMNKDSIPADVLESCYKDGDIHRVYIGQVIDILR